MNRNRFFRPNAFLTLAFSAATVFTTTLALPITAQSRPAPPKQSDTTQAPSEADTAAIQEQAIHLLRMSPVLTSVVARDPSLLADQAYVTRNNPELEQFIESHPDVARNPEFYLFSNLNSGKGRRDQALERAVWPDLVPSPRDASAASEVAHQMVPIIIVPAFFAALIWIVYLFVQSRRWNRAYRHQSEIHGRLIDKFSSSQDLAAYMETEAGKQFLSATAYTSAPQAGPHMPNAVARVLTPLQIGIVMTLLGIGLILLRNAGPDMETPMAVLGTLALMPGIGFILSAGATWILARRLGLLPEKEDAHEAGASGSQDRQ